MTSSRSRFVIRTTLLHGKFHVAPLQSPEYRTFSRKYLQPLARHHFVARVIESFVHLRYGFSKSSCIIRPPPRAGARASRRTRSLTIRSDPTAIHELGR